MSRLDRSVSELWRFRITGIESLNLSAICWASLKDLGTTRCTRTSPLPRATGLSTDAERPRPLRGAWPASRSELVRDLLGVVEGLGYDEVHAHVAVAAGHGLEHGRRAPATAARGVAGVLAVVLGEDVVVLVAPATQAADVGALAVAVLDLRLGSCLLLEVVVILLG